MKKIMLVLFCLGFAFSLSAQINPVTNLTYQHYYTGSDTYFRLDWDVPATSQDVLKGYNIYQGNTLYTFITDDFLCYDYPPFADPCLNDPGYFLANGPFWTHVTAVYNSNLVESSYDDSIYIEGALIGINEIKYNKKPILYPNPTTGKLNIDYKDIQQILIFGLNGKLIAKFETSPQIDLSGIPKGLYFVKLINGEQTFLSKLVLE
ncbi:MAG TPA: T9SS type A sorting domain-containing protein [Flavobacteriaceae bacterium]|nr:T9SS type A sorting domain-containing protein [Flavobacteriaceae bacterium]